MKKMANIYECDNYNIEKVFIPTNAQFFVAEVQRLPAGTYPEKTQVVIPFSEFSFSIDLTDSSVTDADRANNRTNAASLSKDDFLAVVPSYIDTQLAAYDSSYDGTSSDLRDLSSIDSLY